MYKIFKAGLVMILLAGLFGMPAWQSRVSASGLQAASGRWQASLALSPAQASHALDTNAEMLSTFKAGGVAASLQNNQLKLGGSKGIAQLSRALFDDASPWADFLAGPVELVLTLPEGNAPVTLRLQARVTTGYSWSVVADKTSRYGLQGAIRQEMRYKGFGAPAIQVISLRSSGLGNGTVRLVYQRSFEKDTAVRARVNLTMDGPADVLELSDPSPTAPSAGPAEAAPNATDPYADLQVGALPASYDARTLGIIPAVRNQGGCGSCWSFGTVAVMEIAVKKGGGPISDFSEQFLISCNKDGWGCDGGLTASKYHFNTLANAQTVAGAVLESASPYSETNGTCTISYPHPYKANDWKFVTPDEFTMPTNDQVKTAIMAYGAVTAGVCADNGWDTYTGGVYTPTSNQCGGSTNHQIVLVGWDDSTQSWILRNSWGSGWGENGYMRISYDPAGTTSRVGEGTSWVLYSGTTTTAATLYTPSGDTYANQPTYSWSRVSGATSYKLAVKDTAAGTFPINGVVVSSSYCSTTTNRCSYTPAVTLTYGKTYQWQVAVGSGAYSAAKSFKPVAGFNSQFSGIATNWVKRPGAGWGLTASTYYTNGMLDSASSASYNQNFGNFTYQARVKKATGTNSLGLVVRGTPTFGADNDWLNSYQFLYNNSGNFSVWVGVNGVWTALKNWTTSSAIVPNNWNTLKVVADASNLRFYINGTLVWSGTNTSFLTGQVGIWAYNNQRVDVDWATLGMSELYKADEMLESGQVELTEPLDRFGNPLP